MAFEVSSEEPQPPQEEQRLTPAPNSNTSGKLKDSKIASLVLRLCADESGGFNPPTEPSLQDVDPIEHDTGRKSVAEGGVEKSQVEKDDQNDSLQKLQARVSGLEERLRQAGLLEKPEESAQKVPVVSKKSDLGKISVKKYAESTERPSKDVDSSEASIQMLVDRIDSLEKRLEESGHLKDKSAVDKPRLPTIPRLHYVDWSEFKNKLAGEEKIYAIEVLVGGAKYYYQRSEEERKSKQRLNDNNFDRDHAAEHEKSTSLPERIRINSKPIILIMDQIDPTDWSESPVVMLRPFKALVYYEARIREVFNRLAEKWGSADKEIPKNQAVEPSDTTDVGKGTAPAITTDDIDPTPLQSEAESKAEHKQHNILPPSTAIDTHSSHPTMSDSNKEDGDTAVEKPSSEQDTKVESQSSRNEKNNEDLTDTLEALRDLRCLIEFIDVVLKPVVDSHRDTTRQKVSFCDLWHLFKPGDLLHCPLGNKETNDFNYFGTKKSPNKPDDRFQEVWRVASTSGGRPHLEESVETFADTSHKSKTNPFLICAYWIDFNGTRFVSRTFVFWMLPFPGEQDITSLQCYPLRYAPKVDQLRSKWKARGEAFREYATSKYQFRYYTGKTLTCGPDGFSLPELGFPKHAENIDSQVVVDFSEALDAYPGWRTRGSNLTCNPENVPGELSEDYPTCYWRDSDRNVLDEACDDEIYEDEHIDIKLSEDYIESDSILRDHPQKSAASQGDLNEDHLILLPNRVFAFLMKNRKWGE